MKAWLSISALIIFALGLLFVVFKFLPLPAWQTLMNNPESLFNTWENQEDAIWMIGSCSVLLLSADILLPIPSHIILSLNGKLLGFTLGAFVNILGLSIANSVAYGIGRGGEPLLKKFVRKDELEKCHTWLERWGMSLIFISRPVPLLSESLSLLAGANKLPIGKYLLTVITGNLIPALLFAWAGSEFKSFDEGLLIMSSISLFAIALWFIGHKSTKKT